MIKGSGSLVSKADETGTYIPFLTTSEILKQLEKFGFIIKYDLKSNLPGAVTAYLSTLYNIGYDKITNLAVRTKRPDNISSITKQVTVVLKSCEETIPLMEYGKVISENQFNKVLRHNNMINVTAEPNMVWDWVTQMYNISDILDENVDATDDFETITDVKSGEDKTPAPFSSIIDRSILTPAGYSIYSDEEDDTDENGENS